MPANLILLRHVLSEWNDDNLFTGWEDVDFSPSDKGKAERRAHLAGRRMKEARLIPDVVHTSLLKRAIKTCWFALEDLDMCWITIHKSWRLNERHYGALQGFNKSMLASLSEEKVELWRRSYAVRPPELDEEDDRHPVNHLQYAHVPRKDLPGAESLHDVIKRVKPYLDKKIMPDLKKGKTVLVVAHGNSIRAIVKLLDKVSNKDIAHLNIPTGIPLVYPYDHKGRKLESYYLAPEAEVEKAVNTVKNQSRASK